MGEFLLLDEIVVLSASMAFAFLRHAHVYNAQLVEFGFADVFETLLSDDVLADLKACTLAVRAGTLLDPYGFDGAALLL